MNMNDYCYQALLSRTLSKQLPRKNGPGMGREKEGVGSIQTEEVKTNKEWNDLCQSLVEKLEPPAEDYIPTAFQTVEQQRNAKRLEIKEELRDNPFISFVTKGMEYLSSCDACPEGIALVEMLMAQQEALQTLLKGDADADADIGNVVKYLQIPEEQLLAIEKYAKTLEDPALRSALFALLIMLSPHRGDHWFYLSLSLFEGKDFPLALKASWAAVALAPEQPEVYILCAALLDDVGQYDDAAPLIQRAEELQQDHPLSQEWLQIYSNLSKKFLVK